MKIIITEQQKKFLLKEENLQEDYPQSFLMDEFKTLTSFAARIRYCEKHLKRISSGSARIAYLIDDKKVLKLAKNKKGLAQNEVEVSTSHDQYFSGIFAKVFDYDENDLWLEMELAKKMSKGIFKKINGYSIDEFGALLDKNYWANQGRPNRAWGWQSIPEERREFIYEDMFYNEILEYATSYDIPTGDLKRTSSYGLVNRDGEDIIVLIDYGLDSSVYDNYYS